MSEQPLLKSLDRMSERERGYLAGFFDGEGCVSCTRSSGLLYPTVQVCNSVEKSLHLYKEYFGGTINPYQPRPNVKISYHWFLSGGEHVTRFLEFILPDLITKRKPASIGLAIANTLGEVGKRTGDKVQLLRERLWKLLQEANS